MKLASFSVARPVFSVMAALIVVVLGAFSLQRLQVDLLPAIELPTLTVRTEYEGASPEVMEQQVTSIVEEIVATVPGVEELESTSSEGNSSVKVTFGWGNDIDTAAIDVQSNLEQEISELPDDILRPRVSKFDVGSFPVVILGISSDLDPVEMTMIMDEQLRPRLSQLPGVAQVDPWGEFEREVRVELDPERVRAMNVPLDRIVDALGEANLDLPAGSIERGNDEVTLRAPAQFDDLQQIRETTVAVRDGAPVRIDQLGTVRDTYRKRERLARINGQRGLRLAIRKQSDANTVEVSRAVLAEVEAINEDFPQLSVLPVVNQGNFIERSIDNVIASVGYGIALAVVVLLFFLRSLRSTLVVAIAIPISMLATFALMQFGGLTINLMTLGGLALGVGMMVDNSIVVLESIYRRRDEGGEAADVAAVAGAKEVAGAIAASTITTLVIFLPLVFVRGVVGELFADLAIVVAFSLACSLVVSLSIVPMLAARLLRGRSLGQGTLAKAATSAQARLESSYAGVLVGAMQHRAATLTMAAVAVGASVLLFDALGREFLPPSDEGEVRVNAEMPVGTRLDVLDRQIERIEAEVYPRVPDTRASVVSVGGGGRNPAEAYGGEIRLTLSSATERDRSNTEIAKELREALEGTVPGVTIRTRAPQGQFLLERVLGQEDGLEIEVRGWSLEELDRLATEAVAKVRRIPGITDLDVDLDPGVPTAELRVDRDGAAALGLSPSDVAAALQTAVAGADAGDFRDRGNAYRILVQLADVEHRTLDEILDLTISGADGSPVALRSVVEPAPTLGPIVISRREQQRAVTIKAGVAERDMGSVAADVEAELATIERPDGYTFRLAGAYEQQQEAFGELLLSLILSLALVYMVLAAQYESLLEPLVVMLSVPVAAIGVFGVLWATGTTLNVQSYIGCIMLGGIVVNNAILLVDRARSLQAEGMSASRAAVEAGRLRLRPILMTTLTTVIALFPLALGIGEGADAQAPMARAVLGGLAASTLITLLLIPTVLSLRKR